MLQRLVSIPEYAFQVEFRRIAGTCRLDIWGIDPQDVGGDATDLISRAHPCVVVCSERSDNGGPTVTNAWEVGLADGIAREFRVPRDDTRWFEVWEYQTPRERWAEVSFAHRIGSYPAQPAPARHLWPRLTGVEWRHGARQDVLRVIAPELNAIGGPPVVTVPRGLLDELLAWAHEASHPLWALVRVARDLDEMFQPEWWGAGAAPAGKEAPRG